MQGPCAHGRYVYDPPSIEEMSAQQVIAMPLQEGTRIDSSPLSFTLQVRCWEIQPNGTSVPKAAHTHEQPVLCSAWNADGATVYSGGCDNTVKAWNLATNQQQVIAFRFFKG